MALTTEETEVAALGFSMPEGNHFIRNGDDAIRKNAVKAVSYARTAGIVETVPSEITSLDKLTTPGDYQLFGNDDARRLDVASFPQEFQDGRLSQTAALVSVRKPARTNFVWQELTTFANGRNKKWIRQTRSYNNASLAFGEWEEILTAPAPTAPKPAALNLTTPVNGYYETSNAMNHRVPFKLPVRATRYRLHIAARNDANGIEVSDNELRINKQPVIGKHKIEAGQMTGQFSEKPFPAAPVHSIPLPNGNEYVGDWVNTPLEANTDYLFSFSYYNPNKVQIPSGMSGSFIQSATGQTNALDVPGVRYYMKTPFAIWLEIEVPYDTPTIGFIGDSLMVGRDSECPLYYSPAWHRARREKFLPRMHSIAGGRMKFINATPTDPFWTRFAALGKCDAVVIEIGSNDFYDQVNKATTEEILSELKPRLEQTVALARQHVSENIYFCTVLPRNNNNYPKKVIDALRQYNDWLHSLPFGALGCYDWAGTISDTTGDRLTPRYLAQDLVHLNNAGYAAVSAAPMHAIIK